MNISNQVSISIWTGKCQKLIRKTGEIFDTIGYPLDELPHNIYNNECPISMVFVGQYSAGKSTIIKALTGIKDIVIGSGIQTKVTTKYLWNDIEVIDTPGIRTGIRPEHDEITYEAISNADMLVYVITQDLFDNVIGHDFRKILLEKEKAEEMILVVNKMGDIGNTLSNREVKRNDLCKVTAPYTPEYLRTVFIDANSYLDSLEETDTEYAEELKAQSNFDEFINTLNEFARDKGISARLTTVLYKLFDILQKAIEKYKVSTGDEDIDMIEEHSLRERHIISDTAWRVESSVRSIYEDAASKIRSKGYELANIIYDCATEEEADELLSKAQRDVDQIAENCKSAVIEKVSDLTNDCETQLDIFYNSSFTNNLHFRLKQRNNKNNSIVNQFLKTDLIAHGSSSIIASTVGTNATANGLKAFSGSVAHEWVLNIGHYFGHSFKPWEAIKAVKKINTTGKALGLFGIAISLGMQAKEDYDNEKRKIEMRENRDIIRARFNDVANALRTNFNSSINSFLNDNYRRRIDEIDSTISNIRNIKKNKSDVCRSLEQVQDECRLLISDIHKEYSRL